MKKFFLAIAAIMIVVGVASTGHSVVINGERQVIPAYLSQEVSAAEFEQLKNEVRNHDIQINGPQKGLKKRMSNIEGRHNDLEGRHEKLRLAHNRTAWLFNDFQDKTSYRFSILTFFGGLLALMAALAIIGVFFYTLNRLPREVRTAVSREEARRQNARAFQN